MCETKNYNLHNALGYQLSLTARMIEKRFEDRIKPLHVSRLQWCVLLACGVEKLRSPSDIAQFIGVDRTAISRALRQMEKNGFLNRESGKSDRRTTDVVLTEKGQDTLAAVNKIAQENSAHFLAKINEDDRHLLSSLMENLRHGEEQNVPGL